MRYGLTRNTGGTVNYFKDERILGDTDFVEKVLKLAGEELEQKYDIKAKGYDFNGVMKRVADVMSLEIEQITARGKSPQTV